MLSADLDGCLSTAYSEVVRITAGKRVRAWLLLATFVASLGSAQLSADHLIDLACGDVGLGTGTNAARLDAASNDDSQHCVVCHFLRVVRGAHAASQARLAVEDGRAIEFAAVSRIAPAVHPITRPSRGPPAASPANLS